MSDYPIYNENHQNHQNHQNNHDFNQSSFNPNFQSNYQNMPNSNPADSNNQNSQIGQISSDPNQSLVISEPTIDQNLTSQTKPKSQSKTSSLTDIIKKKPMLYRKVKTAYFKQIETDIENGKKGLLDMDRFIVSLIEAGLKG